MSLTMDDLKPCAGCGDPCDGDVCSFSCELDAVAAREVHACRDCGDPCDCCVPDDCRSCEDCHQPSRPAWNPQPDAMGADE